MSEFKISLAHLQMGFKQYLEEEYTDVMFLKDSNFYYHILAVKNGKIHRGFVRIILKKFTSQEAVDNAYHAFKELLK